MICSTIYTTIYSFFCYEMDFMIYFADDKQADIIDAFYTTSSYLDAISNINNIYFDNMLSQNTMQNFK